MRASIIKINDSGHGNKVFVTHKAGELFVFCFPVWQMSFLRIFTPKNSILVDGASTDFAKFMTKPKFEEGTL